MAFSNTPVVAVKHIPFGAWREQAAKWRARIPDWVDLAFDSFKEVMVSISETRNR
jgi:hypothetical protein